jgi:carboxyl-terminal processing protease
VISIGKAALISLVVAVLAFLGGVAATHGVAAEARVAHVDSFQPTFPLLQEVYNTLEQDYVDPLPSGTLLRGAIDGMTGATGDPYTEYYDPQQYQGLLNQLNGQFSGIGVEIQQVGQYIVVESVLPNSPAQQAGLQVGDRIVNVDGKSLIGVSADDAANSIRGPDGTRVRLGILRGSAQLHVTLTRAPITLPTVESRLLPGDIAYLQLNQVAQNAASLFQTALSALLAHHPHGLILDLRDNPGGLVDQAVDIARDFVPSGVIVRFKGRVDNQVYTSNSGKRLSIPVVVLVNGGTASAAEIITGALQDDHLATVVGTKTFGKGIAQEIVPMQNGGVLKVTVAKWYTPNGRNIELTGLKPDQYVNGQVPGLLYAENLLGDQLTLTARFQLGSTTASVNGVRTILDAAPVAENGTPYLSALAAEQLLGVDVVPQANNQSAFTLHFGRHSLGLTIAQGQGSWDGRSVQVTPPEEVNGVAFFPLTDLLRLTRYHAVQQGDTVVVTGKP